MCILILSGCQTTTPEPKEVRPETVSPGSTEFSPLSPISTIAFESGKYADLFSPESYAVWVNSSVVEQKKSHDAEQGIPLDPWLAEDAGNIVQQFVVIELHIESVFADTSIAYDIVGLRGVSAFLEDSEGKRIDPIQRIIGTPVEEEQRGTLKAFRRTNVLVFPRQDVWTGSPVINAAMPTVKLVLESHDSRFNFTWNDVRQMSTPAAGTSPMDKLKIIKVGFGEMFEHLRRLNRITQ